ncbi:hypothetical protein AAFC00_004152 [Neodothiora populina]|uniref:Uncharacterized protein n=1 Tax=Neodothiora populina TaxID=2781224 RepID=A0ABR3PIZ6_9PEZI
MADMVQWTRRVQSLRVRTPLPHVDSDDVSSDMVTALTTPRKKLRPRLSSYFSHHMPSTGIDNLPRSSPDLVSMPQQQEQPDSRDTYVCQIEPQRLMECILTKLMVDPFHTLDARDNSSLLMIFESYRTLCDQNAALSEKLQNEVDCRYAVEVEAEKTEKRWQQEREDYRAEVRRLEILVAKGQRGLVDLVNARQYSTLRRDRRRAEVAIDADHKETVFEFLERTRLEDAEAKRSQRGAYRWKPADWL